jgi:hypothetical protein
MGKLNKFIPDSRWVRYDPKTGLWIPSRKRIYLYWYKFLNIALLESSESVDMSRYSGWGTIDEIKSLKFDEWWSAHWIDLFGYPEGGSPRYELSTNRPKTDAVRYAYLVYTNRHRGSNWDIANWIQKFETSKRGVPVPSFAYASDGISSDPEGKMIVQSRVGRYMRQANVLLCNVKIGVFP